MNSKPAPGLYESRQPRLPITGAYIKQDFACQYMLHLHLEAFLDFCPFGRPVPFDVTCQDVSKLSIESYVFSFENKDIAFSSPVLANSHERHSISSSTCNSNSLLPPQRLWGTPTGVMQRSAEGAKAAHNTFRHDQTLARRVSAGVFPVCIASSSSPPSLKSRSASSSTWQEEPLRFSRFNSSSSKYMRS